MLKRLSSIPGQVRRLPEVARCVARCRQPLKWIYSYVLGGKIAWPCDLTTRDGSLLQLRDWSDLTTAWRVIVADEYQIPSGANRIIDAGANIGAFSLLAGSQCPDAEIVALEPFPETHSHLQATVERNRLGDRISPIQAALAGVDGDVSFDAAPETHSYSRRIVISGSENTIQVPAISIGRIMLKQGWDSVDYLKMDIEGGEYSVFESTDPEQLKCVSAIGLEYHDDTKWPGLKDLLIHHGFDCVAHHPEGWSGLAEFRRKSD